MAELSDAHALAIERSCALTAVALSRQRREGVRLVTGDKRRFGLSSALDFVYVPYPPVVHDWTRRTLTCGVALQCSPSKDRIVEYRLHTAVGPGTERAHAHRGRCRSGMDRVKLARAADRNPASPARSGDRTRRHGRSGDAQPCDRTGGQRRNR